MPEEDSERSPTDGLRERAVASSLDRRNFLKSTAAAAFVSGGFSTHATAQTRTITVSQPGYDTGDLAGEPVYDVGIDRGFYAWIADDTFHLRWTGDTRSTDQVYVVAHDVRTDGTFGDPDRVRFENPEDYLETTTDSRINGRAAVGGSEDGYDVPLADATTVELDLQFSDPIGKNTWRAKSESEKLETVQQTTTSRDPNIAFFGSDRSTPATLPATVSVSTTYEVTPLSGDRPIEDFYGASSQFSSTRLEEPETSHLFLYDGPNGLSLVVIHDAPTDGEDGAVSFDFTGLPTAEGQWVVQDDGGDFDSSTDTSVDWRWPVYGHKDGGAWRGGLDDSFSVTIDPLFNGDARRGPQYDEIKRWRFLSGDASSPDRLPLDMDQPVTITTGTVQDPPGEGVDLGPLIDQKRTRIGNIRSAAAPAIGADEADDSVDVRAEALLDDIENDAFDASGEQYVEALERMNAAERVTQAATEQAAGDDSPTSTVLRDLYSLVTGAAVELLPEVLEGIVGRVVRSISDEIITKLDDMAGAFSGRGIIPRSSMRHIDDELNAFKHQQSDTIGGWVDSNPKQAKRVAETAGSGGLKAAQVGSEAAIDALNEGRSLHDVLEELYFEGYYFRPDWPVLEIPAPTQIEVPDIHYDYDVPDEELPGWVQGAIPDEISVHVETEDYDVPHAGGLTSVVEILEQLQDFASASGIGTTIDDRMDHIEAQLGALAEQDDQVRELVADAFADGIEDMGELTTWLIDVAEDVQAGLTKLADLITLAMVLTVVLAAVALVTGFGTLGLLGVAGTLATVATALGVSALVVDGMQIAAGQKLLAFTNLLHHTGTYGLVETDLGGVDG